jgi:serine protease AprX
VRRGNVVLLAGALALALAGGTPVAQGSGRSGSIDRPLQTLALQRPASAVRIIVLARHAADAEQAVRRAAGLARVGLPRIGGLAAEVRADQIELLARQPGVERVALDPPMQWVAYAGASATSPASLPAAVYTQTIGADQLWAAGQRGRGVGIAVLDSGVHPHSDFGHPSRIVASQGFNVGASSTADQLGHGTWVAGIAAGDGQLSAGKYMGVAPEASIVNLKVSDDTGAAYASDVLQALTWVADNRARWNIRVVNLSMVSSEAEGYATNLLDAAVELVWHSGVVVVVAAGNLGPGTQRYAPANDPYVITVGAADDVGTPSPRDDALAWFSSFGTTQDGFAKPDLVAPGRHIVGPLVSQGARLAKRFPDKVVTPGYIQLSGTSAAAPVVAGAVALLVQARPWLTPDQLKWLLTSTARPLGSGAGAGELDVNAAARWSGTMGSANRGLIPNRIVGLAYLSAVGRPTVSWDSVSWDSVSWDSVSWDSVSWDSVSWDSVSWDSVSWDSVSWDSVLGDD